MLRTRPLGGRPLEVGMFVVGAVLGVLATVYLAVAGPNVGIHLQGDHIWFYGSSGAPPPRVGRFSAVALNNMALGVFALAWLMVGLVVRRGGVAVRALLVVGAVWSVPLVIAPPLFSPDALTYTALGAALNHGVDLYQIGPGAAGQIAAVRGAEPSWLYTPSPYGPLFLDLMGGLSRLLGEHMLAVFVALRLLTLVGLGAIAVMVARLARWHGRGVGRALWLGVLNPLVLISAVSANHNDTLMMVVVLGGLFLAMRGHPLLGIVVCVVAAGIKVVALAGAAVIGVDYALRRCGWSAQARALAVSGLLAVGGFVASVQLYGRGWGWVRTLSIPGAAHEPLAPMTAIADVLNPATPPTHLVGLVGSVVCAAVIVGLLTRLPSWGLVRVAAWVMLALVVFSPVVWAWYLLWPVLLFAAIAGRREAQMLVVVSIGMLFTTLPGGQATLLLLGRPAGDQVMLVGITVLVLFFAVPAALRRLGPRPPHQPNEPSLTRPSAQSDTVDREQHRRTSATVHHSERHRRTPL